MIEKTITILNNKTLIEAHMQWSFFVDTEKSSSPIPNNIGTGSVTKDIIHKYWYIYLCSIKQILLFIIKKISLEV
jgi:hypothetical protein